MTAYAEIYVAPCVSLHAELSRQPWLSAEERIAEAVEVAVAQAIREVEDRTVSVDQNETDCAEARSDARSELRDEVLYIIETADGEPDELLEKVYTLMSELVP